jgi:hypothetical protein
VFEGFILVGKRQPCLLPDVTTVYRDTTERHRRLLEVDKVLHAERVDHDVTPDIHGSIWLECDTPAIPAI